MNNKEKTIMLIERWHQRSNLQWKDVYTQLGISRDAFNASYRRFPKRKVKYDPDEIYNLICIFDGITQNCSAIECLLLWAWCGYTIAEIEPIVEFFEQTNRQVEFVVEWLTLIAYPDAFNHWFETEDVQHHLQYTTVTDVQSKLSLHDLISHIKYYILHEQSNSTLTDQLSDNHDQLSNEHEKFKLLWQALYGNQLTTTIRQLEEQVSITKRTRTRNHIFLTVANIKADNHVKAKETLKVAKQSASSLIENAQIDANKGGTDFYNGYFEEAKAHFESAYKRATLCDAVIIQTYALTGLACIASELGEYRQARDLFKEATQHAICINNTTKLHERLAYITVSRGANAYYDRDYHEASLWYSETNEILSHIPDHHELTIMTLWNEAQVLFELKVYDKANQYLDEAEKIAQLHNLRLSAMKIIQERGRFLLARRKIKRASEYMEAYLLQNINLFTSMTYTRAQFMYHYVASRVLTSATTEPKHLLMPLHKYLRAINLNQTDLDKWLKHLHRRYNCGQVYLSQKEQTIVTSALLCISS
ncbi:MAG: hypothetical protein AAF846_23515 [Chloroflexota bacterium]